jgi:hypothetical protein
MTAERNADRIAGAAMIGAALLSMLAMAHHPTHVDSSGLVEFVHAAMMVLSAVMACGFAHFALRRGFARPAILAGLVAYAIALFAGIGAATINGFVVPALAHHGDALGGRDVFLLAWEGNQALARLGVFATAAAYALWSIDFLRRPGIEPRLIGGFGLAAGLVPAALLASGALDMRVAGAMLVYAASASWAIAVGQHLARGRLGEDAPAEAGGA